MRAQSTAQPGSKALRDVVTEIVEDAQMKGRLFAETDAGAAVEAINLPPDDYDATLSSAKKLIRGSLFARSSRR
jgi:hypothetical protein